MKRTKYLNLLVMLAVAVCSLASCDKSKSYSELLDDEQEAINWYLAQNKVVGSVPEDSVFIVGEDAPFYRMNPDGSVYMRVINTGDMNNRPKKGQTVYFRFTRYNIENLQNGTVDGAGNAQDMSFNTTGLSFVYGNTVLSSTTQYGEGIQVPLDYLGYNCEVDLIVASTEGFTTEISSCYPYLYKNLKYFKAEY